MLVPQVRVPVLDANLGGLSLCYNAAMRAVIQRVTRASVKVGNEITGEIGHGLLVLLGVAQDDTEADADYLAEKIAGLRIFEDDAGKMNFECGRRGRECPGGFAVHVVRGCASRQAAVIRCGRSSGARERTV